MIKIFDPQDTDFASNGNVAINTIKCIETKKKSLNGWFLDVEVDAKYEVDIKQDMLCVTKTKSKLNPQAFRIKNVKKDNNKIKFQAEHVMFDARDYFLVDVRPTNLSAPGALTYINERVDRKSPFITGSNVNASSTAYFINRNLLEAWTVIEERWGGVFDADNFKIMLKNRVGNDNGETLVYGAGLSGVEIMEDWSNVVTRLYATGPEGVMLPQKFIDSDIEYPTPYTKKVAFESKLEEDEKTEAKVLEELEFNATNFIDINKFPRVSYLVKSDVKESLEIGDTVEVKHPLVTLLTEVQEYKYDINTKRVVSLEFGNYSRDVKKKFDEIRDQIKNAQEKASTAQWLSEHQTSIINNLNKLGLVYIDDNEILILDKLPKEEAKNVWRWGLGGLGFSSNGYEGPFDFALTYDGFLNAQFIRSGSLTTNHLSSEVGSSLDINSNVAITNLVRDIESFNNSNNMIPGLTGVQGYVNWVGNSDLIGTEDLIGYEGLTGAMNFVFKKFKDSLSPFGKSFTSNGNPVSPKGFVVPDTKYSYRIKVHTFKPFSIDVLEYSSYEGQVLKSTNFKFESNDKYLEFEIQPANNTSYISLRFNVVASPLDRLEFSEDMFNRGVARNFELSPIDVQLYSESSRVQLSNEIKDTVEAIELVNGEVIKNYTVIQQLSDKIVLAVDASGNLVTVELGADPTTGSYFVVKAQQIKLEGYTTINNGFQVLANGDVKMINADVSGKITATSGRMGDFELVGGTLETTRTFTTKAFTQADLDRARNILLATIEPTQSDWDNLDVDGNGVIELYDLAEIQRCLTGVQPNPMIIKEVITMGKRGSIRTERVVVSHSNRVLSTSVIENGGLRTGSATVRRLYLMGARGGNGNIDTAFEVFLDYSNTDPNGKVPLYAMPRSKVKPT